MRTNLYAYTEPQGSFPAYVSVNREEDGRVTLTVRERGHSGDKAATIELSDETLDGMALALLDMRNVPEAWADRAGVAIQQALDRSREQKAG